MADKKGPKSAQTRFLDRLKSKGFDADKKHLYWSHEAKALKKAIDAYKKNTNESTLQEMEAAVWRLIRARGPKAIQRAKHAEARYSNVISRIDAERRERLKKEKEANTKQRQNQGYYQAEATIVDGMRRNREAFVSKHQERNPEKVEKMRDAWHRKDLLQRARSKFVTMRNTGMKEGVADMQKSFIGKYLSEKAKATYCGRCGTTHVPPKFGGTCPALKKEDVNQVSEVSNELLQRYKEKAGAQVDNPATPSKIKYKRGLGHLIATVKQMKSGKPMPPLKEEDEHPELKKIRDEYEKHEGKGSFSQHPLPHNFSDDHRVYSRGQDLYMKYLHKKKELGIKEEVEQIDELGRGTLASYIKKAAKNARISSMIGKDFEHRSQRSKKSSNKMAFSAVASDFKKAAWKREAGVEKAADRLAKEETQYSIKEAVHPDALHVQPVKVGNQQKYKVHAVGKNFAHGIKVGEHLSDTELDDFQEMGGKIKHIKEDTMKSLRDIMEEMKRGRGRPRKNPAPATKHDSDDEHEYGPSARPASREGSSSHIVQQLASAAHDDLPKKGRDVDFKHHTGFVPQHVAKKAIEHYSSLKRSEDKSNWAADHFEMHHKDFVKKFS